MILILGIVSSKTGYCQDLHTPYPIIFVHGLVGDDRGWNEIVEWLPTVGLTFGGRMDFCLNQNRDDSNSALVSDYKDYTNTNTQHKIVKADFYTINFFTDYYGIIYDYAFLSNQAAVVKQGVAIKDAVKHVLDITGKDKVILVGHSMGGLAIREFIRSHYNNNVAKIVTIGTPHYGSDLAVQVAIIIEKILNIPELEALTGTLAKIDTKSDAVRDLNNNSIYLFGGEESSVSNFYYCKDVNCNGIVTNHITGLNEDYKNLDLVARTYIVSKYSKIAGINGDGVVEVSSQYINPADTIMTDKFHLGEDGEQKDIYSIIRGLDEPEVKELAYEINEASSNQGFITYQRYNASLDMDLYKIIPSQKGTLTLSLSCINPISHFALLDENLKSIEIKNNITTGQISTQVENKTYYIRIIGEASNKIRPTCWNPYILTSSLEAGTSGSPTINTPSPSSLTFGDITIYETSTKDFTISGSNLTGNISVSVSGTGYAISKSQTLGFGTSSLSFSPSGGAVLGTVYVRFSPTSTGSKTSSISISSTGATSKTVSLSGSGVSAGSAPSNDNSSSPQSLTIKTSCSYESFTTVNATPPASDVPFYGSSTCASLYKTTRYDDDVWFKIQPTSTSPVTITVNPTSNLSDFDIVLGLYNSSLSQITCGAKGDVGASESITFTPQANTSYLIRVFSYGEGSSYSGNFDICVTSSEGGDGDCNITSISPDSETHGSDSYSTDWGEIIVNGQPYCSFTVSGICDWLTVWPMSGTMNSNTTGTIGQAFLDYSIEENLSTEPRHCTFYINGNPITITQNGKENDGDDFYIENYTVSPTTLPIGGTIDVSCEWAYSGSNKKSKLGTCYCGYFFSRDKTFSPDDFLLEESQLELGSDNTSDTERTNLTLPSGAGIGTAYILFVADYKNDFSEVSENNNVEYKKITLGKGYSGSPDDFYINNATVANNITYPGGILEAYYDICYSGSTPLESLGSSTVYTYISKDQIFDYTDLYLYGWTFSLSSSIQNKHITRELPSDLAQGSYYLVLVADAQKKFEESDESNNVTYASFTVASRPQGDDFYVTNATLSATSISTGEDLKMNCYHCYLGTNLSDNLNEPRLGYYISKDTNVDDSDRLIGEDISSLGSNDPVNKKSFSYTIPTDIPSGNYYILFVADYDNRFVEINENNNVSYVPITVINNQPPEILVSDISLSFGEVELSGTMSGGRESLIGKTSLAYSNLETASSSVKSFTVSGSNLTGDILISAPNGNEFTISQDPSIGYGNFLDIGQSNGTISATTIYVRFSPASIGEKSGNISISSSGVATQNILVSGIGIEPTPCNLSVSDTILTFNASPGNQTVMITANSSWVINVHEDLVNTNSDSDGPGGAPVTTDDDGPVDAPSQGQWITVSLDSGSNNNTLIITAPVNNGSKRSGTVTVSGCNTAKTIKITQEGSTTPTSDNILNQGEIKVYPNPTTGIVEIKGLPENQKTRIAVYTNNGKLILKKTIKSSHVEIDLRKQAPSTYLIFVNDQSIKIIKN